MYHAAHFTVCLLIYVLYTLKVSYLIVSSYRSKKRGLPLVFFSFFQKNSNMSKNASIFFFKDEREARENVKREQDEAYRLSLEADRAKVGLVKYFWDK